MVGEAEILLGIGAIIFYVAIAATILIAVMSLFYVSKTKKYRQSLSDLYVAAKIRTLAKADDLSLEDEYESFKAWAKKEKIEYKDYSLDSTIEEELIEKVSATKEKKK